MAILLMIETATPVCSVALADNGRVVLAREDQTGASHAAQLGVFVAEAMQYVRDNKLKISAVAISSGPGSYTGLRIGMSEAKGLCYGLDIPLIAIPTLKILAAQLLPLPFDLQPLNFQPYQPSLPIPYPAPLLCPMIDARRMEVYAALYDENLDEIRPVQADIIDADSYREYLESNPVFFLGNGSGKCKDLLQSPNAIFISDQYPTAEGMISLAEQAFAAKDFVDTAYFEPFYLKEFQATTPKNKVW